MLHRATLGFCFAAFAACIATASLAAERAIDKQAVINATLDQAWEAWTTREGIVAFFAPDAKIEPRVGGAFQIYMDPLAEAGSTGADEPPGITAFSAPPFTPPASSSKVANGVPSGTSKLPGPATTNSNSAAGPAKPTPPSPPAAELASPDVQVDEPLVEVHDGQADGQLHDDIITDIIIAPATSWSHRRNDRRHRPGRRQVRRA